MDRIDGKQLALNDFVKALNQRLTSKKLPKYIQEDPLIIGQCVHEVVGGTAVYLMICEERQSSVAYVKIGLARNIERRMSGISTGCPLPIRKALYFCTMGYGTAYALENALHQKFKDIRVSGEWFRIDDHADRAQTISSMVDFADEYLGDNFNSFVFDPGKIKAPNIEKVRTFVQTVWELCDETAMAKDIQVAIARLGPSSSRYYDSVESALNKSWGRQLK